MPPISKIFIASLLGGLIVAGCGGGGSSGGSGTGAATTFPLSTALANLYASEFQRTLTVSGTATSNGTTSTFTAPLIVAETPANPGAGFEGQLAREVTFSMTGTFNINTPSNFSSTSHIFLSPNNLLLGVSALSYCVANPPGQYPNTVTIGQQQAVVTYDCFTDSTKASPTGTGKSYFTVGAGNSSSTATFSMLETFTNTAGVQTQLTEKDFLVDTSGNISLQSLKFTGFLTSSGSGTANNITLTFQSQ